MKKRISIIFSVILSLVFILSIVITFLRDDAYEYIIFTFLLASLAFLFLITIKKTKNTVFKVISFILLVLESIPTFLLSFAYFCSTSPLDGGYGMSFVDKTASFFTLISITGVLGTLLLVIFAGIYLVIDLRERKKVNLA